MLTTIARYVFYVYVILISAISMQHNWIAHLPRDAKQKTELAAMPTTKRIKRNRAQNNRRKKKRQAHRTSERESRVSSYSNTLLMCVSVSVFHMQIGFNFILFLIEPVLHCYRIVQFAVLNNLIGIVKSSGKWHKKEPDPGRFSTLFSLNILLTMQTGETFAFAFACWKD